MKSKVQQKLDQIFSYPFFESVGKPLPSSVGTVQNWTQASKTCGFLKWRNNTLMASNALQHAIEKQYPKPGIGERMQEWNPLCEDLRPAILAFVDSLLPKIPVKDKGLKNIRDSLSWDIMSICFEIEYNDIVDPIFFVPHSDPWYASGHFPCGWDGDEFAHDFESGDKTILFDGWHDLSRQAN